MHTTAVTLEEILELTGTPVAVRLSLSVVVFRRNEVVRLTGGSSSSSAIVRPDG